MRPAERGILVHAVLEAVVAGQIANNDLPAPDMEWSEPPRWASCEPSCGPGALPQRPGASSATHSIGVWSSGTSGGALTRSSPSRSRPERKLGVTADRHRDGVRLREGPFTIELRGGRSLVLAGKVDRVDTGQVIA